MKIKPTVFSQIAISPCLVINQLPELQLLTILKVCGENLSWLGFQYIVWIVDRKKLHNNCEVLSFGNAHSKDVHLNAC